MPRSRVYKTEAIVLRHQNLGDADKIVTVYSPYLGKLRLVGKGVLKPRSRVGGHVEPLTRVSLLIARGQNLDVISQVSPIESFVDLRDDLQRTAQGLYAAELIDLFTGEEDASPELYEALLETLKALTLNKDGGLVLRRYELRLLGILGYAPDLDSCVVCRASSFQGGASFNSSAGGLVCAPLRRGRRGGAAHLSGRPDIVPLPSQCRPVRDSGKGNARTAGRGDGIDPGAIHPLSVGERGKVGGFPRPAGVDAVRELAKLKANALFLIVVLDITVEELPQ